MQKKGLRFMVWDPIYKSMDGPFTIKDFAEDNYPNQYVSAKYNLREDLIFLQYTGMKDRKGKDVYEGDIVQSDYFNTPDIIEWGKTNCGCCGDVIGYLDVTDNAFIVIGNIYENSELINAI